MKPSPSRSKRRNAALPSRRASRGTDRDARGELAEVDDAVAVAVEGPVDGPSAASGPRARRAARPATEKGVAERAGQRRTARRSRHRGRSRSSASCGEKRSRPESSRVRTAGRGRRRWGPGRGVKFPRRRGRRRPRSRYQAANSSSERRASASLSASRKHWRAVASASSAGDTRLRWKMRGLASATTAKIAVRYRVNSSSVTKPSPSRSKRRNAALTFSSRPPPQSVETPAKSSPASTSPSPSRSKRAKSVWATRARTASPQISARIRRKARGSTAARRRRTLEDGEHVARAVARRLESTALGGDRSGAPRPAASLVRGRRGARAAGALRAVGAAAQRRHVDVRVVRVLMFRERVGSGKGGGGPRRGEMGEWVSGSARLSRAAGDRDAGRMRARAARGRRRSRSRGNGWGCEGRARGWAGGGEGGEGRPPPLSPHRAHRIFSDATAEANACGRLATYAAAYIVRHFVLRDDEEGPPEEKQRRKVDGDDHIMARGSGGLRREADDLRRGGACSRANQSLRNLLTFRRRGRRARDRRVVAKDREWCPSIPAFQITDGTARPEAKDGDLFSRFRMLHTMTG